VLAGARQRALLTGLKGDSFPWRLTPQLEIDEFDDDEVVLCLRMGLLRPGVGMPDWAHMGRVIGIRVRLAFEKVVGGRPEEWSGVAGNLIQDAMSEAESVLDALRVFKKGSISLAGLIVVSLQDGGGWRGSGGPHPLRGGFQWGDYELTAAEGESFVTFWRQLKSARKRKLLDAAMRRFSYAGDRHRPDDRLVDLVIAAETLFLGDAGNPHERGELRYRFSLRAAFFLEEAGLARRVLFRFMRNGYDARSAIVHGGEPDPALLMGNDGARISLMEYADAMEDVLRRALREAVDGAQDGDGSLVDWDELVMGRALSEEEAESL
jgi:hypothetical protein